MNTRYAFASSSLVHKVVKVKMRALEHTKSAITPMLLHGQVLRRLSTFHLHTGTTLILHIFMSGYKCWLFAEKIAHKPVRMVYTSEVT